MCLSMVQYWHEVVRSEHEARTKCRANSSVRGVAHDNPASEAVCPKGVRLPRIELGIPQPQCNVLTTIPQAPGEAGYRSQYLAHAKRALYHLSYIPATDRTKLAEQGTLVRFKRALHVCWHPYSIPTHATARTEASPTHSRNSRLAQTHQWLNTRTSMHRRRAWFTCSHLPLCTPQHTVLAPTSGSDFEIDV